MPMAPCSFFPPMLSVVRRLLSAPWIYCLGHVRRLWRLACIFGRGPPSPSSLRPLTDQQHRRERDEFIGSIDTDAIRALASRHNGGLPCTIRGRHHGSFNVCYILDFSDGTTRAVRLPVEPAVRDVWDKVRSEVCTMQYVREHTSIPVPRVYAYGRCRLRRGTSARQTFMVLDYVEGQPLTKKMLRDSPEDRRRRFLGELVDMFAQLRRLEFPRGGSLMPSATGGTWDRLRTLVSPWEESLAPPPTTGLGSGPDIVGAYSMRKNELQVDGYRAPRFMAATAKEFSEEQYRLLQSFWEIPSQELDREHAEYEEFALRALSLEEAQEAFGLEAGPSRDSFYLAHPDLRTANIIVDDELRIRGVVDWEFSATVPRHAFLPPSWITGHDIVSEPGLSSEFRSVLLSRSGLSPSHAQLARDWGFRDDLTLPMAYIFLDPSDLDLLFYRCIYPRLHSESRDRVVPGFFQRPENKELRAGLERRLRASERYTQYLKDNNLLDDTEDPLQQVMREAEELLRRARQVGKELCEEEEQSTPPKSYLSS